jgi:starvation-inducible outer membrane lipoprotein
MRSLISVVAVVVTALAGCSSAPFPPSRTKDVNPNIQFGVLEAQPDAYKGQAVQLAGRIVDVLPTAEGTLVVVQSLPIKNNQPLDSLDEPMASTGKFAFLYQGKITPAELRYGNEVMVLAQSQGSRVIDVGIPRPYLVARCVHIWETGEDRISDFPDYLDTYFPLPERTYCTKQ